MPCSLVQKNAPAGRAGATTPCPEDLYAPAGVGFWAPAAAAWPCVRRAAASAAASFLGLRGRLLGQPRLAGIPRPLVTASAIFEANSRIARSASSLPGMT